MFFTDVTSHDRESCIKSIQATFVDTGSGGYKNLKSQCPVAVSWSAAAATESQSRQQKVCESENCNRDNNGSSDNFNPFACCQQRIH